MSILQFTLGLSSEHSKWSGSCTVAKILISLSVFSRSSCSTSHGKLSGHSPCRVIADDLMSRWVNRKDFDGKNVFEGGFLGLDNIGIFNRSEPLPTGGVLEQADSTGWMAFYSLNMLNIALELAKHRRIYEDIASKFFEHFIFISDAMTYKGEQEGESSLWNEQDGFAPPFLDIFALGNCTDKRWY